MSATMHKCSHTRNAELRKRYKFLREDFGPLKTISMHSDLIFDFTPERVHVTNTTTFCHADDAKLSQLVLDANNLEILSVSFLAQEHFSPMNQVLSENDWAAHIGRTREHSAWKTAEFNFDASLQKLVITLPVEMERGTQFLVRTATICRPNNSMLEGLYLDYTPKGCPQTIISQCQQYGFQRITPSVDQMLNKQTYTTTIIADGRFTNLITNGDLAPEFSQQGSSGLPTPRFAEPCIPEALRPNDVPEDLKNSRVQIVYENCAVPMATYLFFLGVGTYVTFSREVEYPDGSSFQIELLLFPGLVPVSAAVAKLDVIADSILWTHISLGPEALHHEEERKELYALLRERETIQRQLDVVYRAEIASASVTTPSPVLLDEILGRVPTEAELNPTLLSAEAVNLDARGKLADRLTAIRARTKDLIGHWKKPGYKYTGQVYREISMENSQYGGMENVGNTTIVSAVIAVTGNTTDREAVYIEGVTIHEYFHNQNGSEVTGASPFEIWLNEAVTVWFERRRVAERFGEDSRRLEIVRYAFTPSSGPLAIDSSPNSMAVEPEGFNSTTELISAMTYSKAPEFVNMVMLLIGEEQFHKALDLYYTRYAHSNATTADWIAAMEEVSGKDLTQCAKGWLTRTGYPTLHYSTSHDEAAETFTVRLTQRGFEDKAAEEQYPWIFPVSYSLVTDGVASHEGLFEMTKDSDVLVLHGVSKKPDFVSVARGWSFFGRVVDDDAKENPEKVRLQALSDPDVVNRRFAYITVADQEKLRVLTALSTMASALACVPPPIVETCEDVVSKVSEVGARGFNVSADYVALAAKVLFDEQLDMGTRAAIVSEGESSMDLSVSHLYYQLSDAKIALYQAIVMAHGRQLVELYQSLDADKYYQGALQDSMSARSLKAVVLSILLAGYKYLAIFPGAEGGSTTSSLSSFDFVQVAERLIFTSPFMSDKILGLSLVLSLPDGVSLAKPLTYLGVYTPQATLVAAPLISPQEKVAMVEKAKTMFASHPDSWATYISVVGSADSDEIFEYVDTILRSKDFRMELAGHARTICRAFVVHRKRSLLTEEGLEKTAELCVSVGKVNEMSAYAILQSFADINSFDLKTKAALIKCLEKIQSQLDSTKQTSLYNNIARILDSTKSK